MQSLPDSAGSGSSPRFLDQVGIEPYLDYRVQITTPGQYRLWLRWGGYDGSSDSLFAQIREVMTTAGPGPDFYKYAVTISDGGPFGVWTGIGTPIDRYSQCLCRWWRRSAGDLAAERWNLHDSIEHAGGRFSH
jgi:hypothetical protein